MPELPDVEYFRRYLESTALHQAIESVSVQADVLEGVSAGRLKDTLTKAAFEDTRRHGKHLFVLVDSGPWLGLHFGMTGFPVYYKDKNRRPGHERFHVAFANGFHLSYDNQRKLGRIRLMDDPDEFIQDMELGPDGMDIDRDTLARRIGHSRAAVKNALMNQKYIAGIGNVYADEILFQARIDPRRKARDLSSDELARIHEVMNRVLPEAVDAHADPARFPDTWIIPRRKKDGAVCPGCDGRVKRFTLSGRTGYFCPRCQH